VSCQSSAWPRRFSFRGGSLFAATLLAVLIAALLGCSRTSPSAANFGKGLPQVPASKQIRSAEREMFHLLNRDRAAAGLPPLKYDEKLADIARYHSADMRDHKFFAHDSPNSGTLEDRLNAAGYLFLNARENLSEAMDVAMGQERLMQSPPHHENIMSTDVTHVGVGIVEGGVADARNLTMTQVFARPGERESADDARAKMLALIQSARQKRGLKKAEVHPLLQELAERHLSDLAGEVSPSDLRSIGKQVIEQLSTRKVEDLRGVSAGGQLLTDSASLQPPDRLLQDPRAAFGIAVREVPGEGGRPMLQVLLLIGTR